MEPLILMIVVPMFGAALLVAEWQRRSDLGADYRAFWSQILLATGLLLGATSLGMVGFALAEVIDGVQEGFPLIDFWVFAGRLLLWGLAGYTAWVAARVSRIRLSSLDDLIALGQNEGVSGRLRLLCWGLVAFPLMFVALLAMLLAPLFYLVSLWSAGRRIREGKLLWSLAIASEMGLSFSDELKGHADSYRRTRTETNVGLAFLGLPLIAAHFSSGRMRERLAQLAESLHSGRSLSDSLSTGPRLLPHATIMAIRVGEQTGTLTHVLRQSAIEHSRGFKDIDHESRLGFGLTYFWGVAGILCLTTTFLMYWIVPKFKMIFEDFGVELPPVSKAMIGFADHVAENVWIFGPMVGVPFVLLLVASATYLMGWSNLNIPLLMRSFPRRDAPDVLQMLSFATQTGAPLPPLLRDVGVHHRRRDLGRRLEWMAAALDGGADTWTVLKSEGFVNRREADALAAAARTSDLPFALEAIGGGIHRATRNRMDWLMEITVPILVALLGSVVLFYCLSFFMPLVKLLNDLS